MSPPNNLSRWGADLVSRMVGGRAAPHRRRLAGPCCQGCQMQICLTYFLSGFSKSICPLVVALIQYVMKSGPILYNNYIIWAKTSWTDSSVCLFNFFKGKSSSKSINLATLPLVAEATTWAETWYSAMQGYIFSHNKKCIPLPSKKIICLMIFWKKYEVPLFSFFIPFSFYFLILIS